MRSSIPWSADVRPARWAIELLGSSRTSIDWVVPLVYDVYVRLERPDLPDGATHVAHRLIDLLRRVEARSTGAGPGRAGDGAIGSLDACWFAVADLYGWNGHDPLPHLPLTRLDDDEAAALRADPTAFVETRTSFAANRYAAGAPARTAA